ncbi:MAG: hypothetical protein MUE51_00285 [Thermoleophilia bacterium]|nr:hypothetical protein [Thermoleophilia bacterium]
MSFAHGRRRAAGGVAAVTLAAAALGLAACGSSGSDATTAAATAPVSQGAAYVSGLREATGALSDIAVAVLDPGLEAGQRGPQIEAGLTRLEAAGTAMQPLTLDDRAVDEQRQALLDAIGPFTTAMDDVLAAGRQDPVNGGLELVQQREPILAAYQAALAADAGAIQALGETARSTLEQARAELERQLTQLRNQAQG